MAWAAEVSATQLTSITTEQFLSYSGSTNVTLNPGEVANVRVKVDFPATPTDHAVVSVYGSLDSGSNYDTTPVLQFQIDKGTDPNTVSFLVANLYSFRVGVKRSGTTDTLTSADSSHRKNGIAL